MEEKINLAEKLALVNEYWSPAVVADSTMPLTIQRLHFRDCNFLHAFYSYSKPSSLGSA